VEKEPFSARRSLWGGKERLRSPGFAKGAKRRKESKITPWTTEENHRKRRKKEGKKKRVKENLSVKSKKGAHRRTWDSTRRWVSNEKKNKEGKS